MNLTKKKNLAARTLDVGKNRIVFNKERLSEIKDAITKQDIRDLANDKAILIAEKTGIIKHLGKKSRRRKGSLKKSVKNKKKIYMTIVRKLRPFARELKDKKIITVEEYRKIRKEIRAHNFKSKTAFKERISQITRERENG